MKLFRFDTVKPDSTVGCLQLPSKQCCILAL